MQEDRKEELDRASALVVQHARPRWGGGVGPALSAGRPVVAIWSAAFFHRAPHSQKIVKTRF